MTTKKTRPKTSSVPLNSPLPGTAVVPRIDDGADLESMLEGLLKTTPRAAPGAATQAGERCGMACTAARMTTPENRRKFKIFGPAVFSK